MFNIILISLSFISNIYLMIYYYNIGSKYLGLMFYILHIGLFFISKSMLIDSIIIYKKLKTNK